jgi:formylmethanofuran dehydrogenase subunit E
MQGDRVLFKRRRNLNYAETIVFHGHDGPFLALGYRLGKFIIKTMKPRGIMDLRIRVRTQVRKPYTCLLDGLQCSTSATLGKGNINIERFRSTGIAVNVTKGRVNRCFQVTRPAMEICVNANDLQKAARRILRMPITELWIACRDR